MPLFHTKGLYNILGTTLEAAVCHNGSSANTETFMFLYMI